MAGSKPLTIEGVNAMSDAITNARDHALLLTLAGSGLRVGEASRITVADVLTGDRRLRDEIHIPAANTKGKRRSRKATLPTRTLNAIALWLQHHPCPTPNAPLFPSQKGENQPLTTRQIQRLIKNAATKANIEGHITPHSARKYFGNQVYLRSEKDIHAASLALGHTSIAATPIYLDLNADRQKACQLSVFDDSMQRELRIDGAEVPPSRPPQALTTLHQA